MSSAFGLGILFTLFDHDLFAREQLGREEHEDCSQDILDTYREKRAKVLYDIDKGMTLRQSHNNPDIINLYKEFLGEPCSELSEELLHTSYGADRPQYKRDEE